MADKRQRTQIPHIMHRHLFNPALKNSIAFASAGTDAMPSWIVSNPCLVYFDLAEVVPPSVNLLVAVGVASGSCCRQLPGR
eukprot:6035364-Amphidinium_carterae.1